MINQRVVLASRPGSKNPPSVSNFAVEECEYPNDYLRRNMVLIKTCYLSVDPALRSRMNEHTGVLYLPPWKLGECILGSGGIGVVIKSSNPKFKINDVVTSAGNWPWQTYFTTEKEMEKVDVDALKGRISLPLSCLGFTGLTVLIGFQEHGNINPNGNQTCVVSGAAGGCGTLAVQIARLLGCTKVIGICGSDDKCNTLIQKLGCDSAINYKKEDFVQKLQEICSEGVHVYFDNVGGEVSDRVIELMTEDSSVILCGQISQYNKGVSYPPPIPKETENILKDRKIKREKFIIFFYQKKFDEALKQLSTWIDQGKLKVLETIEEGLENTPKAFIKMMTGGNTGKQLVKVSDIN